MQPTNDPDEENLNVLIALDLYRLQSLRNILVVILMIQLLLVRAQLRPNQFPGDQEHDRFQPNEIYRVPEKQPVVAAMAPVKQAGTV